jgi:hypothetical protein
VLQIKADHSHTQPLVSKSLGPESNRGGSLLTTYSTLAGCTEKVIHAGEISYLLDGALYTSEPARLADILRNALREPQIERADERIRAFIEKEDGEYFIVAEHHTSGRCILFNDYLGRLPLYQASLNGGASLIIGRSPTALARLLGNNKPDRLGIMARLLFGYPLDERTEFEAIKSLPESSIVWVERAGAAPRISGGKVHYGGAIQSPTSQNVDIASGLPIAELGQALIAACERRARCLNGLAPTLALSGGFDSRLVACALSKAGIRFDAVTRSDYLADPRDAVTAAQVAETMGVSHHSVSCGAIDRRLLLALVQVSQGALDAGVAHMLGFLKQVRERLGPSFFLLTGDGGDKTVAPLLAPGRLTPRGEVYRLQTASSRQEIAACLALMGFARRDFDEYVENSFQAQPGASAAEKSRALIFRQRMRRWLAIAEDRNRSIFFSTSPFYAPDFFRLSNGIPDALKQRDRLYLALLGWFDERVARIPRPGLGRHSLRDALLLEGYLQLSRSPVLSRLYRALKPVKKAPPLNEDLLASLLESREQGGGIWDLCDGSRLVELIKNPPTSRFGSSLLALALMNLAKDDY